MMLDLLLPMAAIAIAAVAVASGAVASGPRAGRRPVGVAGSVAGAAVTACTPAAPPPGRGGAIVDRATLAEHRAIHGDASMRRYLGLLREELHRRRPALEAAARAGDRTALAEHAHAVASAAASLGFDALLRLGRQLEEGLPDLPDDRVPAAAVPLVAAIDDAATAIGMLDAELAGDAK